MPLSSQPPSGLFKVNLTMTRNNPDPAQFRQVFRQVMVDAILVPSPKANCEEDVDSFLLNLKNFSHAEADASQAVAPVEDSSSELPESMRNIFAVMNLPVSNSVLSTEESNIVTNYAKNVESNYAQT